MTQFDEDPITFFLGMISTPNVHKKCVKKAQAFGLQNWSSVKVSSTAGLLAPPLPDVGLIKEAKIAYITL